MSYLRQFNFLSVCLRMILAMCAGGIIGFGRTRKKKTAGLRTYMLTGIGASLAIMISLYEYEMMTNGLWAPIVEEIGMKYDVSRFAAQVISGAGFLAAGSIIAIEHQQVEGLTTATGLFASVCMGLAAGAGFYECVLITCVLIILVLNVFQPLERMYKRHARNIDLIVEFESVENIQQITELLNEKNASIYDIDIERTTRSGEHYPAAIFSMKMSKGKMSHANMISSIAELDCVYSVEELIA